jgi:hypothetical protein
MRMTEVSAVTPQNDKAITKSANAALESIEFFEIELSKLKRVIQTIAPTKSQKNIKLKGKSPEVVINNFIKDGRDEWGPFIQELKDLLTTMKSSNEE